MVMNLDEDFDADSVLREPDDYNFDEDFDEDEIPELDLGNRNRIHDMDISPEDEEDPFE